MRGPSQAAVAGNSGGQGPSNGTPSLPPPPHSLTAVKFSSSPNRLATIGCITSHVDWLKATTAACACTPPARTAAGSCATHWSVALQDTLASCAISWGSGRGVVPVVSAGQGGACWELTRREVGCSSATALQPRSNYQSGQCSEFLDGALLVRSLSCHTQGTRGASSCQW